MPRLSEPSPRVHTSFLGAMRDFKAEGRGRPHDESALARDIVRFADRWHTVEGFDQFLVSLAREGNVDVPPGPDWVHCSTYWLVDGERYLGTIRIRHALTPRLLEDGGHIGYDVAPAARLKGHGTAMLLAALPLAADVGVDPALITCDVDNVGSRKIIEACGGVCEDERHGKLRYWVKTS